jgi:hypothetical protein
LIASALLTCRQVSIPKGGSESYAFRGRHAPFPMKFEEHVTTLCAQALAARDEKEVQGILAELRHAVHERIEHVRSYLQASYTAAAGTGSKPQARTWQQVVREITFERDPKKVLHLARELNALLQSNSEPGVRREKSA